jgi:hypothetical protein
MSITNLLYKIKQHIDPEDKKSGIFTSVFIFFGIIMAVSLASFFLGRYSILRSHLSPNVDLKYNKSIVLPKNTENVGSLAYALSNSQNTQYGIGEPNNASILADPEIIESNQEAVISNDINSTTNKYVASKNGRVYYFTWCSGAKRILEENRQYFNSSKDARAAGLTPSKTCAGLD